MGKNVKNTRISSKKAYKELVMQLAEDHGFMQKIGWEKPGTFPIPQRRKKKGGR